MIRGFKGFDQDFRCRGFQFEAGKEYEEKMAKICDAGFHFCEHPLDVFDYYAPAGSRFAEVEGDGKMDRCSEDTKIACSKIKIGAEIDIRGLVDAAIKFVFERADWSKSETQATGDQGAASATGTRGAASATGTRGAASATGYQGAASATGTRGAASATDTESVAMAVGYEPKAKGALGCWIVLAEWERREDGYHRKDVQCALVDGETIKADIWYQLKGGQFVGWIED